MRPRRGLPAGRAEVARWSASTLPSRIALNCESAQPLGVSLPMETIQAGIHSKGKKQPPSMASGKMIRLAITLAARGVAGLHRDPQKEQIKHRADEGHPQRRQPACWAPAFRPTAAAAPNPARPTTTYSIATNATRAAGTAPSRPGLDAMRRSVPAVRSFQISAAVPLAMKSRPMKSMLGRKTAAKLRAGFGSADATFSTSIERRAAGAEVEMRRPPRWTASP